MQNINYEEALQNLLQLEFFGMKLGLQNSIALLEHLGNPQEKYKTIHVAGTNGKGSVCAMLAASFIAQGKKTGLYTSPHLVDYRERIRIGREYIPQEYILQFAQENWEKIVELKATFFEVTTALAFKYFADQEVDIAIIETGLGGRLDATNTLKHPLATVVTSIGWDHMAQLGNTLEEIATEKAGIMKPGVPCIVNVKEELETIFRKQAEEVGAPLYFVKENEDTKGIAIPFTGKHQVNNLATVVCTLDHLDIPISTDAAHRGIENTIGLTGFHGRLEEFESPELNERGIKVILDVGHNPNALEAIKEYFVSHRIQPIVVLGLMKDKDITMVLTEIKRFAKRLIAVQAGTSRALPFTELTKCALAQGINASNGGSVVEGMQQALKLADRGDVIALLGSHYVVGDFLANEKKVFGVLESEAQVQ